ncbi:hypothetical protein [Haladaptatus salinisoli]|uniref:hypothetical protein n=1 Tax=Haladaptatus salinisoli TaxID=2884876 RepID=UPI001D0B3004|nr:hypothetical protein [Haladaptatus salinisoli]
MVEGVYRGFDPAPVGEDAPAKRRPFRPLSENRTVLDDANRDDAVDGFAPPFERFVLLAVEFTMQVGGGDVLTAEQSFGVAR